MNISVVYYSRKGTTEGLAEMVAGKARSLGHEVSMVPIRHKRRPGFFKAATSARKGQLMELDNTATDLDLALADMIFLGGPVFAGHINPFMRSFLDRAKGLEGKDAAVFITCASPQGDAGGYIAQLRSLAEERGLSVQAELIGSRKLQAEYPAMARNFVLEALGVPAPAVEGDGEDTGGDPDGDGGEGDGD